MATKTLSQEELLETVGNMSVIELAEFIEAFKDKFNVTIAAAPVAAPPDCASADGGGESTEKTEFTVVLKDVGSKKIQVIKAVREVTSLGLKEAKAVVDSAPSNVKEDITKDEAESIKAKLEEQGATVELK